MQRVNKDSVAIQFACIAMAIITLIPFGRGNISGLEIAFPFMMMSVLFFLLTKRKKNKQSILIFTFLSLWVVWVLVGITYSYLYYLGTADHVSASAILQNAGDVSSRRTYFSFQSRHE